MRLDGHDLALGIAQRCELATEDTAGINVDRVVEEERLGYGRVSIDHECLTAIVRRPVVANGQAKLIRLSRRLAEEGELSHCSRPATVHGLLQASVGNDQLAIVEDIVADKAIEELGDFDAELIRLLAELFHRLCKAVRALYIPASQSSHELHIVIAGNAERLPGLHHA